MFGEVSVYIYIYIYIYFDIICLKKERSNFGEKIIKIYLNELSFFILKFFLLYVIEDIDEVLSPRFKFGQKGKPIFRARWFLLEETIGQIEKQLRKHKIEYEKILVNIDTSKFPHLDLFHTRKNYILNLNFNKKQFKSYQHILSMFREVNKITINIILFNFSLSALLDFIFFFLC